MWPFSLIKELKNKNEHLKEELEERNRDLKDLLISETDKQELEFLRMEIKNYITYSFLKDKEYPWYVVYRYIGTRTLQEAESDLTKSKFYISVLEA
jgi:hypothetical protein